MAVHTISLFGAIALVVLALILFVFLGPVTLLVLILAAILFFWAFGPGARSSVVIS
jgi:hypothetical protein